VRQIAAAGNARYFFFRHSSFGLAAPVLIAPVLAAALGALALPHAAGAQQLTNPSYTREQAAAGKAAYPEACATCHGANLDDGEQAPPLKGVPFRQRWGQQTVETLFTYVRTRMPPARPGSLDAPATAALLAYLIQENNQLPGDKALPGDPAALRAMLFPSGIPNPGGGLSAGVELPPLPARVNPLDKITPVTDAMLARVPEGDWLTWRRGHDSTGFSPLKAINKDNVRRLRSAWTWSLPAGPNEITPLVHDGVLFVHAFGDRVQALDAVTGDLLWQYARQLPRGVNPGVKRAIALHGDKLFVPTSDVHMVALDVKTGNVVWDQEIADRKLGFGMTGGPLVAKGKVMVGTTGRAPGGNVIVGLDEATGKEAWRFHVIAQPGEPGGNSWNGLPLDKRNGASVWIPGSYDATLNLAFFGPAQTYDTGPLRDLSREPGVTNDGLYTDSTVALDPDTGKLVWHFQHQNNDQWDYDWAFERALVKLPLFGEERTVVVTGGKQGIFDQIDAAKGLYASSFDLGVQNVVLSIDPKTGVKNVDPRLIPGDGEAKRVCPHAGGARMWLPTSYDPASRLIFVPLVESCADLTPVAAGERPSLTTGVRWSLRPRPDSDGRFGRIQAVNLETRKVAWIARQRAPQTTGVLATAGGLVFAGALDRILTAYDSATGAVLWKTRLNDVPNGAPMSFMAGGKQYIALTVGGQGPVPGTFTPLVPEILNPIERSAALWVFEIAE
jgi:alcohol dehydrogenase (cytochrome c)